MGFKKRGKFYGGQEVEGELDISTIPIKFDKDQLLFLELNDVRKRMNNLMSDGDMDNAKIHLKNLQIWIKNKTSREREKELNNLEEKYLISKNKSRNSKELLIVEKNYLFKKFELLMKIIDEEITEENVISRE